MLPYPMAQTRRALIRRALADRLIEAARVARAADEARAAARWARLCATAPAFDHLAPKAARPAPDPGPYAHLVSTGAPRAFPRSPR